MSPLKNRIAYKKKEGFSFGMLLMTLILISALIYLLFYFKYDNKTIYARAIGFFRSEIEKSPAITILGSNKDIQGSKGTRSETAKTSGDHRDSEMKHPEKDEIEEVIKKKLLAK